MERLAIDMSVVYGIFSITALALIGACLAVDRKRDIYLISIFVSVFVCNLGFFCISVAPTLAFALNANRLAYLGQVFLPVFLMMMILNFCNIRYPAYLPPALFALGGVMLLVVASPGIFPWYYKSAAIEVVNGVTHIVREYGPLHRLYYFYLFGYLLADTLVILWAAWKKRIRLRQHVIFLLAAVYIHVLIWLAEQFLPRGFEYLSISYIMTEIFILILYSIVQEYGLLYRDEEAFVASAEKEEVLSKEPAKENVVYIFAEENVDHIFENCEEVAKLTNREKEVLRCLLADKLRKDIAEELCLSESTIKKYTSFIFKKMEVENRKELFAKLAKYI